MSSAIDRYDGSVSFVGPAEMFRKNFPHDAPGYTTRRYTTVTGGRLIGLHRTGLARAARKGHCMGSFEKGYWLFSLADLSGFMLSKHWRGKRARWTAGEVTAMLNGYVPKGRCVRAVQIKRSRIKTGVHHV